MKTVQTNTRHCYCFQNIYVQYKELIVVKYLEFKALSSEIKKTWQLNAVYNPRPKKEDTVEVTGTL